MQYRRSNINRGTYFFTVNLANRREKLLTEHIHVLRHAVKEIRHAHPFQIIAMVVLPDHLRAIWQLPESDADFSLRWPLIKAKFSKAMPKFELISGSRQSKRERGIWQRRFWEHQIRNDNDLEKHVAYIFNNPVKHGYVKRASDWPYSSIQRAIVQGMIHEDWGWVDDGFSCE
jgi:putative transposase